MCEGAVHHRLDLALLPEGSLAGDLQPGGYAIRFDIDALPRACEDGSQVTGQVPHPNGGEMVGGLFHVNYPGGSGLMSGAVFGRIAGREAVAAAPTASEYFR